MSKTKDLYTQISGGKYKGKKLLLPSLTTTRSTKSIVKESLFNTIQFDIEGALFVEVFGGSGSMGLEALSRGAKDVYFIERDKKAYDVLCKNSRSLDFDKTHPIIGDSFEEYPKLVKRLEDSAFIYFDPPFDIRDGMEGIYERVLDLVANTPKDIVIEIIIEHMTSLEMPEMIGDFKKRKFKKFGRSALSYYKVE
jgi:16S rRNA (guanine(966)-N(2))-methyltransferase RsmD